MNLLSKIAIGLGTATTSLGWAGLTGAFSDTNNGDWNWQYKGAAFKDRVGNFTLFSDNKSRYNDYLKGYNRTIGYDFNLVGIDPQQTKRQQIIEDDLYSNGSLSSNENLALIGNPTGANTSSSNNLILENRVGSRSIFVTSFNEEKKRPNWVAYTLRKSDLGSTERQDDFRYDTNVASQYQLNKDGIKGFQRGHNVPSSARTVDEMINSSTFVMTNMTAQAGGLNTGAWKYLEHYLRDQVKDNNQELVILSGNYGSGGIGTQGYRKSIDGVEIPSIMWKVAIFLDNNGKISSNSKSIVTAFPNQQNTNNDWRRYQLKDGRDLKKLLKAERLLPALDPDVEEAVLKNAFSLPEDKSKLISLDELVNNNIGIQAVINTNARAKGIHNPLLGPLFDPSKSMKGFVISNKRTHSESFEMARYNASMMSTGRFTSAIEVADMSTVQGLMYLAKGDQLTDGDRRIAEVFDYATNSPSLASRINEYFFIPAGMGRVYKEEKGFIPSLFGAVGALIDQSYITNNPVLKSYKSDGDSYYTTKNSIFQDLLENSSAAILATVSSIGVYLAVGEPIKAMISEGVLNTQKTLIEASDKNRLAKTLVGGTENKNIGFKMQLIERAMGPDASTPFYDVKNNSISAYYLDNYARYRGASFFEATAQNFLLDIVNPYIIGGEEYIKLRSAINDYVNEVYKPADIKLVDRLKTISGVAKTINWSIETIEIDPNKKAIPIKDAIDVVRHISLKKGPISAVDQAFVDTVNNAINNKYAVDITNVSLERSMTLAKKTQAILNLIPMPWAWGIFAGQQQQVTAPMIGNLLDIEGFTRHINASISNQGFWGAANEFMYFNIDNNRSSNAAYRIVNHLATSTRAILSFNERGGKTKADLEAINEVAETYSSAETKVIDRLDKTKKSYVTQIINGRKAYNTDVLTSDEVVELLDVEATYQKEWRAASGKRANLNQITLDDTLYKYANKSNSANNLGFSLHTLDRGGKYTGMKIASTKLAGAKWIIGTLFIPHLLGVEFLQRSGASVLTTALQQMAFNGTTTNTTIELQSTNFTSGRELAKYFGASNNVADIVGNVETVVSMAGLVTWAYAHASSYMPEIQAKLYQGNNVYNSITEIAVDSDVKTGLNYKSVSGLADIENILNNSGHDSFSAKLTNNNEVVFSVVKDNNKIVGLQTLNAKVMKNMTSFGITLGLSLAAMQTARYLISSTINTERQITGSAFLSTYLLAVPAVAVSATSMIDNIFHTTHMLTGGKLGWTYNDYRLTQGLSKGITSGIQAVANILTKGNTLTRVAAGIGALVTIGAGYTMKLTPFQGDINGPKLDEINTTAITKLGKYVEHVNRKIDNAYKNGGDTSVSDTVSPLEVNAALFAIALSKIMNPILSSQKGSTAYVVAIQSPTPIFQYYSVYKTIKDTQGNTYSTLNLGLQGPPAFGFAPINLSLPIALAMNAESSNKTLIRTGYFGSGIMLNENNKDTLSIQDYFGIYSNVAFWSAAAIKGVSTLYSVRTKGVNKQILKSGGQASLPPLVQTMKGGRDVFLSTIGTLPLKIAAQSFTIATGDLRMSTLRLRGGWMSFAPIGINTLVMAAFSNHIYNVIKQVSQPYVDKQQSPKDDKDGLTRAAIVGGSTILFGMANYYKGTIQRARELTQLEAVLVTSKDKIKYDMSKIDYLSRSNYSWVRTAHKAADNIINNPNKVISKMVSSIPVVKNIAPFVGTSIAKAFNSTNRFARGSKLLAPGILFYHFITDPTVGLINPEVAFGDLKTQEDDRYTWSPRRLTTVAGGALLFAATASVSGITAATLNPFQNLNTEEVIQNYRNTLSTVHSLRQSGSKIKLWYYEHKMAAQGKEIQTILNAVQHETPIIQSLIDKDNKLKDTPYANLKEAVANNSKQVINEISQLDPTNTGKLDLVSAAKNDPEAVLRSINKGKFGPNEKTVFKAITSLYSNASTDIKIQRITRGGMFGVGLTFMLGLTNNLSQALGYKDFQDVFIGADNNKPGLIESIKLGLIDLLKIQTKYDRQHSYDLAKGLVGPNFKSSKGEYLLAPENTVKGSINKALKNISNLIINNAPNTFVGGGPIGITVRPDDNDVRVRDYFQLQSASQDFSSAMYSMSSVFGLQELAKKGFLANTIIAATRGVDDQELNQAQLRSIAANIITAVYSQPIRKPKERIKFTAPNKLMLEGLQGNRQLSMSVSNRLKNLQAMSYGTTEQLALYTLTNNMFIADPAIQNQFYKALRQLSLQDDQSGLGELNQNTLLGGRLFVNNIKIKGNNDNPFNPFKLTTVESNNEDAFFEMQGIAVQMTTNQYLEDKNLFERGQEFFTKLYANSALQGLAQALPPGFQFAIQALIGSGLALSIASLLYTAGYRASMNQISVDNTRLFEQQSKFYNKGNWYKESPIIAEEAVNKEGLKYLAIRRTGVVFNVVEGLNDNQIRKYTDNINSLQARLSQQFDTDYQQYGANYGREYANNKTRLEQFQDDLIDNNRITTSQTTKLITKQERELLVARNYSKEFQPVMGVANETKVVYKNSSNQKLVEHSIDVFTQKQVLDAYLEGQYLQHRQQQIDIKQTPINKQDFIKKYYDEILYDDLLKQGTKDFRSNQGFNIFGKDRFATRMSVDLITEVYAAKYDYIVDTFFDSIDQNIDDVFKLTPDDNIYKKFSGDELNSLGLDEIGTKKLSADRRMQMKLELRENIKTRMNSIFLPKREGTFAMFDRLLTFISGNPTVKDNIQGMTLQAGDAAMETIKGIRMNAGGMFNGQGNQVPKYLSDQATKAVEDEIIKRTGQGVKGSMPVSNIPDPLQSQGGTQRLSNALLSFGQGLMAGLQMMQFASMNLLTMRAAASISSSKTGEREKEMAREELAKEGFENIFNAMFWGTILSGELLKGYGVPVAGGLVAGYVGYELLFNRKNTGMNIAGTAAGFGLTTVGSILMFHNKWTSTAHKWGASLALAGLVMFSRGALDTTGSAISSISPQAGRYITDTLEALNSAGRTGMRKLQDQSQYINLISGGAFLIGGGLNILSRGANTLNIGITAVGALLATVGFIHAKNVITDNKDSRWEGASRAGLSAVANILASKYGGAGLDWVSKTVGAKVSQEIGERLAIASFSQPIKDLGKASIRLIGGDKLVQAAATRLAATKAAGSFIGRAAAGFFGGPWGATIAVGWSLFEIVSILIAPEFVDNVTSNISNWPTQMLGGYGSLLLQPSNQIYQDKRYRDLDTRNPLYFGTVTDNLKQEWTGQVDTLTDFTGRTTVARNVGALDAPMGGYQVTSQGYGPRSLDSVEELALTIKSKAYNQLVTGRQYWNSRLDTALNVALVNQYMNVSNQIQMQAWENDIKNTVEREKARITKAPVYSAKDYKQAANKMSEVAALINNLNLFNLANKAKNETLVVNMKAQNMGDLDPNKKMINGVITVAALKAEQMITQDGTKKISLSKSVAPNNEQTSKEHYDFIGNNIIAQHNITPII